MPREHRNAPDPASRIRQASVEHARDFDRLSLAGRVEIIVIAVPRERVAALRDALSQPMGPGIEVKVAPLRGAGPAEAADALRSIVGLDPDEWSANVSGGEEGMRAPLFGAETTAATLAEELANAGQDLPASHVAVFVAVRHDWREQLRAMAGADDAGVLMHTWVDEDEHATGTADE